jgi:hypothetical protein
MLLGKDVFEERNYLPQFVLRQISMRAQFAGLLEGLRAEGMSGEHTYFQIPFHGQGEKVKSPYTHNIENHKIVLTVSALIN